MTLITVTGHIVLPGGGNASGQVEFTPNAEMRDTVANIVVPSLTVIAQLVAGAFSVQLYATTETNTLPVGVKYQFVQRLVGAPPIAPAYFALPASPSSQDIADLLS